MSALALALVLAVSPAAPPFDAPHQHVEGERPAAAMSLAEREAAVRSDTDLVDEDVRAYFEARAASHPNESFRLAATEAASRGQWPRAARMFRISARFADKYSQHRLSLLHWYGVGVAENRVEGYIWADLAAERGYPRFLAIREKMWAQLSETERAQVAMQGPARYAEFGDAVAKKRFGFALAIARNRLTGSRTGFDNGVASTVPGAYDATRLRPDRYWALEDRIWRETLVRVGEVEAAGDAPAPEPPSEP